MARTSYLRLDDNGDMVCFVL